MKKIIGMFTVLTLCTCSLSGNAQDDAAAQKAWTDYMTPGDFHKMLAKADGEWKYDLTVWMAPGAPPSKSSGTSVNKMILGGRYQESRESGSFQGMPFEGINILGYDNARKVFVSSWFDNMGTGIIYLEGKWDPATKSINLTGKETDPMTGTERIVKEKVKWLDDNTQVMEMFMVQDGKDFKTMEIKSTRK